MIFTSILLFISQIINVFLPTRYQCQSSDLPSPLKQIDYSQRPLITSNLPRSDKAAIRTKFNWNDFGLEKEKLEERYPPKIDVSYGTPSYMPAETMLRALVQVADNQSDRTSWEIHQYTRSTGYPRLVKAVADFYGFLMERDLDPMREVLITAGSLNSLNTAARAFINPGDEVIVFEPFYFDYRNFITLVGGKMVPVPLKVKKGASGLSSNDWTFERKDLESKISRKTKLIWLNNPNNPIGKVYTRDELTIIGEVAIDNDLLILSDEAAQWYIYDEPQHTRIATLPGLFERTLTLTSGGKTFSNTGWRIGWVIAPEKLLWPMATIINSGMASIATPMQIAFAIAMESEAKMFGTPESHFIKIQTKAKNSRNLLVSALQRVGADVIVPTSGYCVIANFTKLINQVDLTEYTDPRPGLTFFKYLFIKERLATFPITPLYSEKNMWQAEYTLRFTNFKNEETFKQLDELLPKIFKPNGIL